MAWIGLSILVLFFGTPLAGLLEQTMFTHLLIEFPLLIFAGYCLIQPIKTRNYQWLKVVNKGGIAGLLIASFTLAFWMIPKW